MRACAFFVACVRVHVRVRVRLRVRACVCACVRACVRACGRKGYKQRHSLCQEITQVWTNGEFYKFRVNTRTVRRSRSRSTSRACAHIRAAAIDTTHCPVDRCCAFAAQQLCAARLHCAAGALVDSSLPAAQPRVGIVGT